MFTTEWERREHPQCQYAGTGDGCRRDLEKHDGKGFSRPRPHRLASLLANHAEIAKATEREMGHADAHEGSFVYSTQLFRLQARDECPGDEQIGTYDERWPPQAAVCSAKGRGRIS